MIESEMRTMRKKEEIEFQRKDLEIQMRLDEIRRQRKAGVRGQDEDTPDL